MGVAKVKRVQPPQAPHPSPSSKPPGNLIFIEFKICDEGRPEIFNFQKWVLVIVDSNQQVTGQYQAEKLSLFNYNFF